MMRAFFMGRPTSDVLVCDAMVTASEADALRRVLLVEDDQILRQNYEMLLKAHRLSVRSCATKADAISIFDHDHFDIIILDVTLGSDYEAGFDLCRLFREKRKLVPIIFLTEHDDDTDRISGLRIGADDYLNKTISAAYLVARIHALIRRVETLTAAGRELVSERISNESNSPLRIDERLSRAIWRGTPLNLSLTQFWILRDLFQHQGEVRSTTDLMRAANITVQANTIVVHIKTIREAIQQLSPDFSCIKSERARGYRWVNDDGCRIKEEAKSRLLPPTDLPN